MTWVSHKATVGFDDLRLAHSLQLPDDAVRDAYGTLKYVRQVKTPAELDLLRTATQLNQQAIEQTIATWSRGTTWQEMVHTYNVTATALGGFVRDPGAVVMANAPGVDPALYMTSGLEDFVVEPGMHIMWDCHGTWAALLLGRRQDVGGRRRAAGDARVDRRGHGRRAWARCRTPCDPARA